MAGFMLNKRKRPGRDQDDERDAEGAARGASGAQPEKAKGSAPSSGEGAPKPGRGARSPNQPIYDKFVKNGMRLIYDEKATPMIVQSLEGDGSPVEGLINTIGLVMSRLTASAEKSGFEVPPDVMMYGAGELLAQLVDFSEQTGGHKYTDDEVGQAVKAILGVMAGGGPGQPPQDDQAPPAGGGAPGGQPAPRGLGMGAGMAA